MYFACLAYIARHSPTLAVSPFKQAGVAGEDVSTSPWWPVSSHPRAFGSFALALATGATWTTS